MAVNTTLGRFRRERARPVPRYPRRHLRTPGARLPRVLLVRTGRSAGAARSLLQAHQLHFFSLWLLGWSTLGVWRCEPVVSATPLSLSVDAVRLEPQGLEAGHQYGQERAASAQVDHLGANSCIETTDALGLKDGGRLSEEGSGLQMLQS